jgi:hypothetical protein
MFAEIEAPDPQPAPFVPTHVYVADKAARAYGSRYAGLSCMRVGPWTRGKALMRFWDGSEAFCLVGNGMMRRLVMQSHPYNPSGRDGMPRGVLCQGCGFDGYAHDH